jgi:hypothetical protein
MNSPLTCAACLQAFFILGEWLLALLAWLLPEWRHLSLAAAGNCHQPVVAGAQLHSLHPMLCVPALAE